MTEPYIRKHTIYPDEFPESWASGWGEDEFGLWMAFTYKAVSQKFRWCEPGAFLMGALESDVVKNSLSMDESQHEVSLSNGFWMADTAVSQVLWEVVMRNNPSEFKGENRPVENVSWDDAQSFIKRMNDMKPELKLCLPTEAQWEYACRAGSTTRFCWGDEINSELVNFNGNASSENNGGKSQYREMTVDVESFYQNDWGLWQMHGNVYEWCQDWFGDYPRGSVTDPRGPNTGSLRVLRGGSWMDIEESCRSAFRGNGEPNEHFEIVGFRLVIGN